jgi:diguanylate cyclase
MSVFSEGSDRMGSRPAFAPRPERRPAIIAMVIATMVVAVAGVVLARPGWPTPALGFWLTVCVLSEWLWVRLPLGNATLSMASCFNLAALLVLPRGEAMLAVGLSIALAEGVLLRKPLLRVLFNSAQTALAVGAASLAFALAGGTTARLGVMIARLDLLPFVWAALAYSAVNTGAVSVAVAMAEGTTPWHAWRRNFANLFEMLVRGALLSLGVLVAVNFALTGPAGTLFVALPLVVARQAYARRLETLAAEASSGWRDDPPVPAPALATRRRPGPPPQRESA